MDLFEELKNKIPFAYYIDGSIIVVSGDKCNLLYSGIEFERINKYKKILNDAQNHTKIEIQDAIHKISSLSSSLVQKSEFITNNISLNEYLKSLKEEQRKELEKEVTKFKDLFIEYMK